MTITIIGILAGIAVPSFNGMIEGQRLKGAAELLASDLRWARGEAIKRGVKVQFTFTSGSAWTYSVVAFKDADNDNIFDDETVIKLVSATDFPNVELEEVVPVMIEFEPFRATVTNLSAEMKIDLKTPSMSAGVLINEVGRVYICGLRGYEAC